MNKMSQKYNQEIKQNKLLRIVIFEILKIVISKISKFLFLNLKKFESKKL